MKKLLLILFLPLFLFSQEIDERVVDFYFGNGVWNTPEDAEANRKKLENLIRSNIKITQHSNVKLAYNWTHGEFDNVVETVFQRKFLCERKSAKNDKIRTSKQ